MADGRDHPAERIRERSLQSAATRNVLEALRGFALDAAHPDFAAAVLRCLGRAVRRQERLPSAQRLCAMPWQWLKSRFETLPYKLRRGGAGKAMRSVLGARAEPVPWLRAYIQDVVEDLGE